MSAVGGGQNGLEGFWEEGKSGKNMLLLFISAPPADLEETTSSPWLHVFFPSFQTSKFLTF